MLEKSEQIDGLIAPRRPIGDMREIGFAQSEIGAEPSIESVEFMKGPAVAQPLAQRRKNRIEHDRHPYHWETGARDVAPILKRDPDCPGKRRT